MRPRVVVYGAKSEQVTMGNFYIVDHGNTYEGSTISHADSDEELLNFFDPRSKDVLSLHNNDWFNVYALHGSETPITTDVDEIRTLAAARPDSAFIEDEPSKPVPQVWVVSTQLGIPEEYASAVGSSPEEAIGKFVETLRKAVEDEPINDVEPPLTLEQIEVSRAFVTVSGTNAAGRLEVISAKDERFDDLFDVIAPIYGM